MDLKLIEILKIKQLDAGFFGDNSVLNQTIRGISIDSRKVTKNQLFIAIKGDNFDGHSFIENVLQNKACAVVVEKKWVKQNELNGNFIAVPDTLNALQEISGYYRSKFNYPFISLTGSNGKTTTKEMVATVLSKRYRVLKNEGNLNNHIGVPLTLCRLDENYNMGVIEMGANHFGEIARLSEISQPNFGLITNIGPAHLEFFGSLEGVAKAKTELWKYLESTHGTAFVNIDDDYLSQMIPNTKKVVTYGFNNNKANIAGEFIGCDRFGYPRFSVMGTQFKLKVVGMHNIHNALAAVTVGLEFNLDMNQIKSALNDFLPSSKRMEVLREKGLIILNDCYNSNRMSAEKALITLNQLQAKGRRIAVLADMLELGDLSEPHHRDIGELAAKLSVDYLLCYGKLSKYTLDQARSIGFKKAEHFEKKSDLILYLKNLVIPGDVILIKGSRGMAMEEVTQALTTSEHTN